MREECKEFTSVDGSRIFYRYRPAETASQRAVVLFHRGHEHSGRAMYLAEELELSGFSFFAWDCRGHGQSPGERGDSPDFMTLVADTDAFIRHISEEYGLHVEDIAVIGQSVGAVLLATWMHDYAPRIRCAVLASPAFDIKLYVPFALPALRLRSALFGNFFIKSYVKASGVRLGFCI